MLCGLFFEGSGAPAHEFNNIVNFLEFFHAGKDNDVMSKKQEKRRAG